MPSPGRDNLVRAGSRQMGRGGLFLTRVMSLVHELAPGLWGVIKGNGGNGMHGDEMAVFEIEIGDSRCIHDVFGCG